MGKKKKGRSARKAQAARGAHYEPAYLSKAPHSFIISRGVVGRRVKGLIGDMRTVMAPYTASKMKVRRKNVIKDFVSVAGPLGVSHLLVFSKPSSSINLRVIKLPRGPTLTFKVINYTYIKDVVSTLKKPAMFAKQFQHHPLLVMNGFSPSLPHHKLITTMFQNMFPPINVTQINLSNVQRCLLINYDKETDIISFRHYNIRAVPRGVGRGVKKLTRKQIPNLAKYENIEDYMLGGNISESEGEMDGAHNEVTLPQDLRSRGNIKGNQAAIRLTEIGPRLSLRLYKIMDGCASGNILYHHYIKLTPQQIKEKKERREQKNKLKQERKMKQDLNVKRKMEEKEKHKEKSLQGMKNATGMGPINNGNSHVKEDAGVDEYVEVDEAVDEDREWYVKEVGEEPDEDVLRPPNRKRKREEMGRKSEGVSKKERKSEGKRESINDGKSKRNIGKCTADANMKMNKVKTRKRGGEGFHGGKERKLRGDRMGASMGNKRDKKQGKNVKKRVIVKRKGNPKRKAL